MPPPAADGEGVLVARDLTPAEAAGLDLDAVHGVVLADGSADLARGDPGPLARHPAGRRGRAATCSTVPEGTPIVIDGAHR